MPWGGGRGSKGPQGQFLTMCAPEGLQGPGKCQNGCTSIALSARERGGVHKKGLHWPPALWSAPSKGGGVWKRGSKPPPPPGAFQFSPSPGVIGCRFRCFPDKVYLYVQVFPHGQSNTLDLAVHRPGHGCGPGLWARRKSYGTWPQKIAATPPWSLTTECPLPLYLVLEREGGALTVLRHLQIMCSSGAAPRAAPAGA